MKSTTRLLLALLAVLSLLAASCGDDDDEAIDTSETTEAGDDSTTTAGDDTGDEDEADAGDEDSDADERPPADGGAVFDFVPLDVGGQITKEALSSGEIDVALLFTSDADIAVNEWVLLEDDQNLQTIENLLPAIRDEVLTPEIEAALNEVSSTLTTEELTELNRQVTVDALDPDAVAGEWLSTNGLVPYEGDAVDASLTIGSTNFFEQEIVAELYAQVLESAGASVDRQFQLGAREIVAPALESGEIDLYPEYVGTYATFLGAEEVPTDPAEAVALLNDELLPEGVTALEASAAQNQNGLVVTQETADEYGLSTTSDLASVTDTLTLGGPPECPDRPFCIPGFEEVYGISFNI
ncbi:MAG: glycine betaine ABC transporter substrate-binding protein [Actinomycetota bacterium]|nr:glycine betaine ABC transporter substrate-binding protein [Actinomycetota bacterium]